MVYEKLKLILTDHLEINEAAVTMESDVAGDLGADSLALLDILMDLEEAFDVDIPEKKIGTVVGDLVAFVEAQLPQEEEQHPELLESA